MPIANIVKVAAAAVFALWAVYTEFRLRNAQISNEVLRRQLDDKNIESTVDVLSGDAARAELSKNIGPGTT